MSDKKLWISGDFISKSLENSVVLIQPKKKTYFKVPVKGFFTTKKTKKLKKLSEEENKMAKRYAEDWTLPEEGVFLSGKAKKLALSK